MEFALGVLQWTPKQFWASTMIEVSAAAKGLARYNNPPSVDPDAMTQEEWKAMKAKLKLR
jgi:hypothetical protein